ncbi:MAG: hypothetical protein GX041_00380 [Clostridiales bacterium]|jgi:putative membrane protein|nr:hypothetical protein [Clostridiales bacterium]
MSKGVSGLLLILCAVSLTIMPITITHADKAGDNETIGEPVKVEKNETVYVILAHNGKVLEQRVVNRLYSNGKPDEVVDYGDYISVRSMETGTKPEIRNNRIIWDSDLLTKGDIYYEGITDKELPVEIDIKYFLDDVQVNAEDLAGKSGIVRIEIKIKNRMKAEEPIIFQGFDGSVVSRNNECYTPFLVQVSYEVDLDIFSEVKAEDAVKITTGKTMNVNFSAFPYPDSEFSMELKGNSIELNPITFTVFPRVMPVQDIEMGENLEKLFDGLEQIQNGLTKLGSAADSVAGGSRTVYKGQQEFYRGISNIAEGSSRLNKNSDTLIAGYDASMEGFDEIKNGTEELSYALGNINPAMKALGKSAKEISTAMESLKKGADELETAGDELVQGYAGIRKITNDIAELVQDLAEKDPGNTGLQELQALVAAQNQAVSLLEGAGEGIRQGADTLSLGLENIKEGLDKEFIPGLEQVGSVIEKTASGSESLIDGMTQYKKGQAVYRQGLADYITGVKEIAKGLETLKQHSRSMSAGLDELVKALENISGGLADINKKGFSEMEDGIIQAIEDMRFAEAFIEKMEELANDYRSFADNQRNRNSSVQFIMKTDRVVYENDELKPGIQDETESKVNWWEQLLKLFGL